METETAEMNIIESGKDSDVITKMDSNEGEDALEVGKQDVEVTEKITEVLETRQTEEVSQNDNETLSHEKPSLVDDTTATSYINSTPFALPGSQDTLTLPPAAQPRRTSTPPRRSRSPAHPTSSSSSDDTITHTTRQQPQSRPNSTLPSPVHLPFEEIDDDDGSEDSLMMKPLDSSATKSTTGGGEYRSRSTSADPKARGDVSKSSLSRIRHGTDSPLLDLEIGLGSDLNSTRKQPTRKNKTSAASRTSKRSTSVASQSEREDEEDSADDMDLLAETRRRKQRNKRRSSFLHVDVPPASSSRNSSTTESKRSSQQPASPRLSPAVTTRQRSSEEAYSGLMSFAGGDLAEKKRRKKESHGFEISIENEKSRSPSPRRSPDASETPTQSSRKSNSASPPPPSMPLPTQSTQPHPLSELAFDAATQETVVHSSPLSSVPASTQPHPESSPSQPITAKRPLASTESEIEDEASATPNTDTSSPKKKARVPKVTVKEMNPPPVPSSSSTATKNTRKPPSKARAKKEEVESEPVVVEEGKREEENQADVGNGWAVRPKRKKSSGKQNMREDTSDEGEGVGSSEESEEEIDKDVYSSPAKKRRASVVKKVKSAKASPRAPTTGKGKKKDVFKPESRSKGKGKGKAKATSNEEEDLPAPSSSPHKTSLRPASSFMLQLSQAQPSTRETAAQREKGWDVRTFDDYIWVHVEEEEGKGGFWWPGRLTNKLRSERPLLVELFVDPDRSVLDNSPTPIISIDEPSPDNLLQFRSRLEPSKMRFTKETFRDATASTASDIPDTAFDAVIEDTLKLERSFGSDDSSDDLPDPSQIGTSQRSKKSSNGKRRASSDRESQDEEDAVKSSESEEELMKEDEEIDKFPFYCLAKVQGRWWPATCVGTTSDATNGNKRGSKAVKKYKIEYSDGSKGDLARSSLLLLRQRQFQTVRIEEYEIPIIPGYLERAIKFIKYLCSNELQRLLDETYPPAQFRNDSFYAGGSDRETLAKSAVYGELNEEQTEAISDTILEWLQPETGERPTGSPRYEALTESDRVTYLADVLLPVAVILNYVDDRFDDEVNIEAKAREALEEKGIEAPSNDEVEMEVYSIAYKELNSRSAAKAIASFRQGRKVAVASKASKKNRT